MTREEQKTKCGKAWENMKQRCYSEKYHKKYPTYKGCYVCDDWLNYDNFKKWFEENYNPETMKDFVLDKDILVEGNKTYSPDTCCFVPQEINNTFKNYKNKKYSTGVFFKYNKFVVLLNRFRKRNSYGGFYNENNAKKVYEIALKDYRQELAEKYKNVIDIRVYNKLIS